MKRVLTLAAVVALGVVLTGCGNEEANAPGAVSPGEAKALDEAAAMLDERRLPPEALPTDAPADTSAEDIPAPAEKTGDAVPARP